MKTSPLRVCLQLLVLTLAASTQSSFAQFVWLDGKGIKQYSDMPPPPSVPRNRILKSPGVVAPTSTDSAAPVVGDNNATNSQSAASATATTKSSAPMTTAERNADYTKRKMEEAEKEKKSADAAKLSADKKANCDRARSYSRGLEDGVRVTTTDKTGERAYLSDEQRAQEIRNAQRVIADCR